MKRRGTVTGYIEFTCDGVRNLQAVKARVLQGLQRAGLTVTGLELRFDGQQREQHEALEPESASTEKLTQSPEQQALFGTDTSVGTARGGRGNRKQTGLRVPQRRRRVSPK